MFTCRDATASMTAERDGALGGGWRAFMYRFHMTVCPFCRRCRRQLEETILLSKEIPSEPPPSALESAAVEAFRAQSKGSP